MQTTPTVPKKPIQFAVFNGSEEITEEMYKEVQSFDDYVKDLQQDKQNRPDGIERHKRKEKV